MAAVEESSGAAEAVLLVVIQAIIIATALWHVDVVPDR